MPPETPTTQLEDGHTKLHWAAIAPPPALQNVLSEETFLETVDPLSYAPPQKYQTPLHWACTTGALENVLSLLSRGADPTFRDARGYDAALHASHFGRLDVLHLLLQRGCTISTRDSEGHTALMWASYYGHLGVVRYLIVVHNVDVDERDESGCTALHRAVQQDHPLVVEALLEAEAVANIENNAGKCAADMGVVPTRSVRMVRKWPGRNRGWKRWKGYVLVGFFYVALMCSYERFFSVARGGLSGWAQVVGHIALLLSVYCHLAATFSDPGDIEKGTRETFVKDVERCIERCDGDVKLLPSAYCFTCLTTRPTRAKHSRERNVCVRRFDHECPWVNNSVGLRTHRSLLGLAFFTAMAEVVFIYAICSVIYKESSGSSIWIAMSGRPVLVVLTLIHIPLCVFCMLLLISHLQLVASGKTTYEHMVDLREGRCDGDSQKSREEKWRNCTEFWTCSGRGTDRPLQDISLKTIRQVVLSESPNDCILDPTEEERHLLLVREDEKV